jgi:multicomponent Na+:H+ antiporter subunit E
MASPFGRFGGRFGGMNGLHDRRGPSVPTIGDRKDAGADLPLENAMDPSRNQAEENRNSAGRAARIAPFFLAASVLVWLALTAGRGLFSVPAALTLLGGVAAGTWAYRRRTPPIRPLPLAKLAVFFLHQSVVSGLDVARRAFSPGPDIDPGLVDYETRLERESARILFANLMSLLPGTLCCRLEGRKLRVHALCRKQPVQESLALLESKIHDALR